MQRFFWSVIILIVLPFAMQAQARYFRGTLATPGGDLIFFFSLDRNAAGEPFKYTLENGNETIQSFLVHRFLILKLLHVLMRINRRFLENGTTTPDLAIIFFPLKPYL